MSVRKSFHQLKKYRPFRLIGRPVSRSSQLFVAKLKEHKPNKKTNTTELALSGNTISLNWDEFRL